jgi:hypothetical protein
MSRARLLPNQLKIEAILALQRKGPREAGCRKA